MQLLLNGLPYWNKIYLSKSYCNRAIDRETLSAIVYFEWSPPRKMMPVPFTNIMRAESCLLLTLPFKNYTENSEHYYKTKNSKFSRGIKVKKGYLIFQFRDHFSLPFLHSSWQFCFLWILLSLDKKSLLNNKKVVFWGGSMYWVII